MRPGLGIFDGSSGYGCNGDIRTDEDSSTLLFESVLVSTDGEELLWGLVLVVVLNSPSEPSVVFDTLSELVVKGLTVNLGIMVLCVNPLRIFHVTDI